MKKNLLLCWAACAALLLACAPAQAQTGGTYAVNSLPPQTPAPDTVVFDDSTLTPAEIASEIFKYFPLSSVPSGILMDYSLTTLDYSPLQGLPINTIIIDPVADIGPDADIGVPHTLALTDESVMGLMGWYGLNETLHDAQVQTDSWDVLTNDEVAANLPTIIQAHDAVPLGLILADFNRIKPSALDDEDVYWSNNWLMADGTAGEIFETQSIVALAPLSWADRETNLSLVLTPDMVLHNGNGLQAIEIWQNGSYQPITIGQAFNVGDVAPGDILYFQITRTDGLQYYASMGLSYLPTTSSFATNDWADVPDEVVHINATRGHEGAAGGATVSIAYGCGNDKLTKPLIYVEGFNPQEYAMFDGLASYSTRIESWDSESILVNDLLEDESYDLVYIDFDDGGDFIQRNAYVVQQVITWVNQRKAENGSTEQNVVIGSSMGGLVARYALADMENVPALDHDTRTFISLDSPHEGANVPVAFQEMALHLQTAAADYRGQNIDFVIDLINKLLANTNAAPLPSTGTPVDIMNNPAARQMLIVQADEENSLYDEFMAEYENMVPTQCRYITLSNGSGSGQGQIYEPVTGNPVTMAMPGDVLAELDEGNFFVFYTIHTLVYNGIANNIQSRLLSSFLGSTLGGVSGILATALTGWDVKIICRAIDNNNASQPIYEGRLFGRILGFPIVMWPRRAFISADTPNIDVGPGGYNSYDSDFDFAATFPSATVDFGPGKFNYIPVASGLDINPADFEPIGSVDEYYAMDMTDPANQALVTNPINWAVAGTSSLYPNEPHTVVWSSGGSWSTFIQETMGYKIEDNKIDLYAFLAYANLTESTSRLLNEVNISAYSTLYLNSDRLAGITEEGGMLPALAMGSHVDVSTVDRTNCDGNAAIITIGYNGTLELGDQSAGNTATLYVRAGSKLVLQEGSETNIHDGSTIVIECGATLEYHKDAVMAIAENATIINAGEITLVGTSSFPYDNKVIDPGAIGPIEGPTGGIYGEAVTYSITPPSGAFEFIWELLDANDVVVSTLTTTNPEWTVTLPNGTPSCSNNGCVTTPYTVKVTIQGAENASSCATFEPSTLAIATYPSPSFTVNDGPFYQGDQVIATISDLPQGATTPTWNVHSVGPDPSYNLNSESTVATITAGLSLFYVEVSFSYGNVVYSFEEEVFVEPDDPFQANQSDDLLDRLEAQEGATQVMPNPSTGRFNVVLPLEAQASEYQYTITHPAGSVVWQQQGGRKQAIDLNGLRPGLYYLTIIGEDVRVVKPIIVQ